MPREKGKNRRGGRAYHVCSQAKLSPVTVETRLADRPGAAASGQGRGGVGAAGRRRGGVGAAGQRRGGGAAASGEERGRGSRARERAREREGEERAREGEGEGEGEGGRGRGRGRGGGSGQRRRRRWIERERELARGRGKGGSGEGGEGRGIGHNTNGAPHRGAPLVFFFISTRAKRLCSTRTYLCQAHSTSSTGQQPVLTPGSPGFDSQAPQNFF